MSWDARQRAMLEAMGLKIWTPPSTPAEPSTPAALASPAVASVPSMPAHAAEISPAVATPPRPPEPARAEPDEAGPARAQPVRALLQAALPPSPAEMHAAPRAAPLADAPALPDAARLERIAHLGWDDLQAEVAQCRACGLCESRKHTVFGVGHSQAHWMVVGEAPGEQEDLQGEPFVGAAGQLLDNMLRALALSRAAGEPAQQVFIANTLKCRPPRNRNPDPQELAQCEPFLNRQIALVQPRIILAMGRFAVQSLLRSNEPIGKLRGRVHQYQGVPLIVTYHPAYLLRNLADKARAWEDLCLARSVLDAQR